MRVGRVDYSRLYGRLVPPHITVPDNHISTSATRGPQKPLRKWQRVRCRLGFHPPGHVWDVISFKTGEAWTRCDACGKWWDQP